MVDKSTGKKWADLSAKEKEQTLAEVQKLAKSKNALYWLKVNESNEIVNKLKESQQFRRQILQIYGEAPANVPTKQVNELREGLQAIFKQVNSVQINIHHYYGFNSEFRGITNMRTYYNDNGLVADSYVQLDRREGQVLVMCFWNYWSPESCKVLDQIQQMYSNNKEWARDVRVVALSVDQSYNKVAEFIETKKQAWPNIEHGNVANFLCRAIYDFEFQSVPFVVLVGKKGKIWQMCQPSDLDKKESKPNAYYGLEEDIKKCRSGIPVKPYENSDMKKMEDYVRKQNQAQPVPKDKAEGAFLAFAKQSQNFMKEKDIQTRAQELKHAFIVLEMSVTHDLNNLNKKVHELCVQVALQGNFKALDTLKSAYKKQKFTELCANMKEDINTKAF